MASEILHSQTSSSESTLPAGFAELVRDCAQALRDLHAQETTLVTQLADLLDAVAQESDEQHGKLLMTRLTALQSERSLP